MRMNCVGTMWVWGARVPLDEAQRLFGVPPIDEHDRVLGMQRVAGERRDRSVVVRRGAEVHVVVTVRDAEQAEQEREELAVVSGSMAARARLTPLGLPVVPDV